MHQQKYRYTLGMVDMALILLMIVYLFLLLFKLPAEPFYYENDQLIFLENAERMLRGETMYRDFFQFTFPGCQVLYYLLFLVFGPKFWLAGFVAIVAGTGSFCVCLALSKHLIKGPYALLPAVVYGFFGLRWFGLEGSHRVISALFVWVALLIVIKMPRRYAVAGVICALSSFFLQNRGVAAVAAFGVFILCDNYAVGWKWTKALRECSSLVLGFLVSISLLCSYFIATAGLGTFVWSTLIYPANYYKYYEQNNYGAFLSNLKRSFSPEATLLEFIPAIFYSFAIPLAIAAFLVLFWVRRQTRHWEFWRGPMLLAVTGAVLISTTAGPNYLRFFHISVPSLILLFWLADHLDLSPQRQKLVTAAIAVLLVASSALIAIRFQLRTDYVEINAERGKVLAEPSGSTQRYLWLNEHTRPGDHTYEVYPSYVYFLLGLRSASRFQQMLPTEYTRPEFAAGTVEDLERTKPVYILWRDLYSRPVESREPGDNLGPLAEYVETNYERTGRVFIVDGQPSQIWQRR